MKILSKSLKKNSFSTKHYSKITLLLFLLSLVLNCNAQNTENKITVPMDLSTMVPRIQVSLNGKGPYNFELDTGAGISIIDKSLASELNLKVIDQLKVGSPGSKIPTLADVVKIHEISASDISLKDISMITMDLGDIANTSGILSLKHFSEFLITLGYPQRTVSFEKGELNALSKSVIPYGTALGAPGVQIEINHRKMEAFLDSGYPGSFAFPYSLKDELNFISPLVEAGTAYYIDVSVKMWRGKLDGQIKLGNVVYDSPEIILEERDNDFITVGFEAIRQFSITIDQKSNLLKLERDDSLEESMTTIITEDDNEFTGRYGSVRTITVENGDLYIQRDGGMKLKLEPLDDDLYKMVLLDGFVAQNILPLVKFDRNKNNEVHGIIFIHEDGTEESVRKDQ